MMEGLKDYWQILVSLGGLIVWGTRLEGKVTSNRELHTQSLDTIEKKVDKLDERLADITDFLVRNQVGRGNRDEPSVKRSF